MAASETGSHRVPVAAAWRVDGGAAVRSRVRILRAWRTEANAVAGSAGFMDLSEGKGATGFANGSGVGCEGGRGAPVALGGWSGTC